MKKLAALILLAACATAAPQPVDPDQQKKLEAAAAGVERYLESDPANAPVRYVAATRQALAGNGAATAAHLSRLDSDGWTLGAEPASFRRVAADPAVREILGRLAKKQPRVSTSSPAFSIREADLMPEGIAYDATRNRFFVGSIRKRKIISVAADGSVRNFVPSGHDGVLSVLGMKVDPIHEILWAASSGEEDALGMSAAEKGQTTLYGFDLTSGGARKKLPLGHAGQLNDLCVMSDGRVYVTDSMNGAIYTADRDSLSLETVVEPGKVRAVNGIACDEPNRRLYVAQFSGVGIVDLGSRTVTPLTTPAGEYVGGIDGLTLHGRSLIGIQNAVGSGRVIRLPLGDGGRRIERVEVLEAANPLFHLPTTGTIAGRNFVYIANSQLQMFPGGVSAPGARPPLILSLPLE